MTTDIHHHMLPTDLVTALSSHGIHTIGGEPVPKWQPQMSLDIMDRRGINRAILSAPVPLHFLSPDQTTAMAATINHFGEDCLKRWPDRFGYFASLPLPDVQAAVSEATAALDRRGAAGVTMLSNHAGLYQGDPQLDPLYAELDRRQAIAFIHPAVYTGDRYPTEPGAGSPVPGIQPSQLEFGFDTTRAVANLIFNQVDRRFPGVRFVFTHSSACVPSILHKLLDRRPMVDAYTSHIRDHGTPPPVADLLHQLHTAETTARERIRWLYFDTALSSAESTLDALTAITATDHILLGTDFPFGQEIGLRYTLDGIRDYPRFAAEQHKLVLESNANSLLPAVKHQTNLGQPPK